MATAELEQAENKTNVEERLARIESMLKTLVEQKAVREWYTVNEAAEALGKQPFTVREWCRYRRINAVKRQFGRGRSLEWMISRQELERFRRDGLLPIS